MEEDSSSPLVKCTLPCQGYMLNKTGSYWGHSPCHTDTPQTSPLGRSVGKWDWWPRCPHSDCARGWRSPSWRRAATAHCAPVLLALWHTAHTETQHPSHGHCHSPEKRPSQGTGKRWNSSKGWYLYVEISMSKALLEASSPTSCSEQAHLWFRLLHAFSC